jgi:hypothetical protein
MAESAIGYFNALAPLLAPEGKDRSKAALPATADCVQIHLDGKYGGSLSNCHGTTPPVRSLRR